MQSGTEHVGARKSADETPSCRKRCDHKDVCKYHAGIAGFVFREGGPEPPIDPDQLAVICKHYTGTRSIQITLTTPEKPTKGDDDDDDE